MEDSTSRERALTKSCKDCQVDRVCRGIGGERKNIKKVTVSQKEEIWEGDRVAERTHAATTDGKGARADGKGVKAA